MQQTHESKSSSPKRVFVLNGHPAQNSLNRALVERYVAGAQDAGHDVRLQHVHDMRFDPDFEYGGYDKHKPLEADLDSFMEHVKWAEHVVVFTPMWWGGMPAKLKGVFDRAFLPGTTFDTRNKTLIGLPKPMLGGRTGRIVVTADTPMWFERLAYRRAIVFQLRDQILKFVGIKPAGVTWLAGASEAKDKTVSRWMDRVGRLGARAA